MSSKGFSSTKFWLSQVGLALLLVVLGGVVIFLRQETQNEPKPEGAPEKKTVASGLSNFYREFRMSSTELIKEPLGDFTLSVGQDDMPLDQRLQKMSSALKPVNSGWVGEHKYRTFEAGSTLRTAISQYAQEEGMQVVWDLEEDFVVKHQFQMNDTIIGSVADIAKAIDANFNGDVKGYFCPNQRSLVLTTAESKLIAKECRLAR
jgi:hypothetical protein